MKNKRCLQTSYYSQRKRLRVDRNIFPRYFWGGTNLNGNTGSSGPSSSRIHILRVQHLKAAEDDDSLYGCPNNSPARLFGKTYKNSIMSLERETKKQTTNAVAGSRFTIRDFRIDETNGKAVTNKAKATTNDANSIENNGEDVAVVGGGKEDEPHTNKKHISSPPAPIPVPVQVLNQDELFGPPFRVLFTSLGKRTSMCSSPSQHNSRSNRTLPRIKVADISHRKAANSTKICSAYTKKYSPIIPRVSTGPIMHPLVSSAFRIPRGIDEEGASKYGHSLCTRHTGAKSLNPFALPNPTPYSPLKLSKGGVLSLPFLPASNRTLLCNNKLRRHALHKNNENRNLKNEQTSTMPPFSWKSFFLESRVPYIAPRTEQAQHVSQKDIKAGEWKCMSCLHINPAEALTCDSCTANPETDKSWSKESKKTGHTDHNKTEERTNESSRKKSDHTDDLQVEELELDLSSDSDGDESSSIFHNDALAAPMLVQEDLLKIADEIGASGCDCRCGADPTHHSDWTEQANARESPQLIHTCTELFPQAMDLDYPEQNDLEEDINMKRRHQYEEIRTDRHGKLPRTSNALCLTWHH